ncbi:MAG TPA: phosphatase PAP2 family protein [Steroidobacteraceae bacterium]
MGNLFQRQHKVGTTAPTGHQIPWSIELVDRVRQRFILTVISTTLLTGLFFVGYFCVQRHPAYAPTMMPQTGLDRIIPFQPQALLAYVSLWVYVGVGPGVQRTVREFAVYGLWLCGLCLCGLSIFYLWPTQVPSPLLSAISFPGFGALHRVDETSNACPSMHVAVAIFTAVRVGGVLRSVRAPLWLRSLNVIWCMAIVYSTLAIKQHVVLDVIAGALVGLLFALMSLRWRPQTSREPGFAELALPTEPASEYAP